MKFVRLYTPPPLSTATDVIDFLSNQNGLNDPEVNKSLNLHDGEV